MRNKFFKRALSMAMSLCLVLSMSNMASAAKTETERKIDLSLNVARGQKSVTAEIVVDGNKVPFQELQLKLGFDPAQLEFKGVQAGTSGMELTVNQEPNAKGSLNVIASQAEESVGQGVVYTATFGLKEGASEDLHLTVDPKWSEGDTAAVNVIKNPIKFCVDVLGKLVSYKAGEADTSLATITLYKEGVEGPAYTAQANEDSYTVMDVAPGAYTVEIAKPHHASRTYQIEVDSSAVTQDAQLNLLGDATLDGKVDLKDANAIYRNAIVTTPLEGYALECGDTNGDKSVDMKDFGDVYNHTIGMSSLWD